MFYLLTPFNIMNIERLNSLVRDYDNARDNLLDATRVALYPLFLEYGRALVFDDIETYAYDGRGAVLAPVTVSGAILRGDDIYFRERRDLIRLELLHPSCLAGLAMVIEKTARAATD